MKFNKNQCCISAPGKGQPWLYIQTGGVEMLEKSPCERDLGVLVHSKLNESTMLAFLLRPEKNFSDLTDFFFSL